MMIDKTRPIIARHVKDHFTSLLVALSLLLVLPLSAMAVSPAVGTVTAMAGEVRVLKAGEKFPVPVKKGDSLSVGDLLQTKSNGNAKITFIDNSEMMVGPKSRLLIEEYQYDPASGTRNASLKLTKGTMGFDIPQVKDKTDNSKYVLKTKSAVAGVRGTGGITLSKRTDKLYLKHGKMDFSNRYGSILVFPGMVAESIFGQAPSGMPFSEGEYRMLEQNLTLLGPDKRSKLDGPRFILVVGGQDKSPEKSVFQKDLVLIELLDVPPVSAAQVIYTTDITGCT